MLTQELHLTRLENASLRDQLAPPGSIPIMAPPQPLPGPEDFAAGTAAIMDVVLRDKSRSPQYVGSQLSNSMIASGRISTGLLPLLSADHLLTINF